MNRNTLLYSFAALLALTFSLAACKQAVIEPVPDLTVSDIRDYFWHDTTAAQTFVDDNGVTANTLSFIKGNNGFTVADAMNTNGKLTFEITQSEIDGVGFKPGSIIDLDSRSFFAADPSTQTRPKIHTAVVAKGSGIGGYFIATDKGVWLWGAPAGSTSSTLSLDAPGLVFDYLTADGFNVYGATYSGEVWVRDLSTTTANAWKLLPSQPNKGALSAFTVFQQVVYAAPKAGGLFFYYRSYTGSSWPQLLASIIKDQVTALYPYNDNRILIGFAKGLSLSYTPSSQYLTYQRLTSITSAITSYLSYPNGLAIGTENGLYFGANDTDDWKLRVPNIRVRSLAQRNDPNNAHVYIAVIANSTPATLSTYDLDGNPVTLFVTQPPSPFTQFVVNGGSTVVCQDSICAYGSSQKWMANMLPFPTNYAYSDGPLTLLNSSSTTKDASWSAGSLVTETDRHSYPFTGRIVEHLDKLTIGGKDYPDVLQVHYSHEGSTTDTIPAWTVFYQKNRGPIMVTKSKTVGTHTTVASKHVTN